MNKINIYLHVFLKIRMERRGLSFCLPVFPFLCFPLSKNSVESNKTLSVPCRHLSDILSLQCKTKH